MATHSSILAWEIQWTEEPGGLQSMGHKNVGHDFERLDDDNEVYCLTWDYRILCMGYHNHSQS